MPQDIQTIPAKTGVQYPYRAVICGEEHFVNGWNGGNLITRKGEFTFKQFYGDFAIHSTRLLEVALLQLDQNGEWLLNGYNLQSLQATQPVTSRLHSITRGEVLRVHKEEIHAVAWVQARVAGDITQQLDTVLSFWKTVSLPIKASANISGWDKLVFDLIHYQLFTGWSAPIWLKEFQPIAAKSQNLAKLEIASSQPANVSVEVVKPTQKKATKVRQPKPVARFENEFSIAVIPQKGGTEVLLTIENELRDLIMKIMAAGGRQPRTHLRSYKLDTYQPEKLLKSKVAKSLIKAGLLGTSKSGRTTVFWAKQHAG